MPVTKISRRNALQFIGTAAGTVALGKSNSSFIKPVQDNKPSFTYCLNMATIRGHKLGFVKELETASKAGFGSVEIWIDTFYEYLAKGGTIADAKKLLNDLGLKIENSISFNEWIVDDATARKKGIEEMKKEMGIIAELGCKRIAATAKGATNETIPGYDTIAERYSAVLELGDTTGVVPILEMWGFTKNMSKVSEVLYIAMESRHPSAKVLLDIYHLYRGHTSLETLHLLNPVAVDILHMNDYTANFPYQTITDADRVYPGDGVAPYKTILSALARTDQPLVLSCEVFNKIYYAQDALIVAKTALSKMKTVVANL